MARRKRYTKKKANVKVEIPRKGWLRNAKDIADKRKDLIEDSSGVCSVTKELLERPVLDHAHVGSEYEGKCRGVLSSFVNLLEGRFRRDFNKYGAKHTDLTFAEFLINMGEYLQEDYSGEPFHYKIIDEYKKRLNNKLKGDIVLEILEDYGNVFVEKDGELLHISSRRLTKNELVQKACELFIDKLEDSFE